MQPLTRDDGHWTLPFRQTLAGEILHQVPDQCGFSHFGRPHYRHAHWRRLHGRAVYYWNTLPFGCNVQLSPASARSTHGRLESKGLWVAGFIFLTIPLGLLLLCFGSSRSLAVCLGLRGFLHHPRYRTPLVPGEILPRESPRGRWALIESNAPPLLEWTVSCPILVRKADYWTTEWWTRSGGETSKWRNTDGKLISYSLHSLRVCICSLLPGLPYVNIHPGCHWSRSRYQPMSSLCQRAWATSSCTERT